MTHSTHRVRVICGTISTDDIIPGRYKHMYSDPALLGAHVLENRVEGFAASVKPNDAIWCDDIFGIGSSREQAATSLLAAGVSLVLAPEFGRIFFRNAWNVGLRLIRIADPPVTPLEGTGLEVDWDGGVLDTAYGRLSFAPPPARLQEIVAAGGLLAWIGRHRGSLPSQSGQQA